MGGSLGMALRGLREPVRVFAWGRHKETREAALRLGAADEVFESPTQACESAEVVVVCTPVMAVAGVLRQCAAGLAPGALVTDVASVKAMIAREAELALAGSKADFIGSHPITGAEQQGINAARSDLYKGAVVVITPTNSTSAATIERARNFWNMLHARARLLEPDEHDRLLARTSHLPHLAAVLLSCVVGRDANIDDLRDFCGPGFKDTTRLASGGTDLWNDIVKSNHEALRNELRAFGAEVTGLLKLVDDGDFEGVRSFLAQGRSIRNRLLAKEGETT